MILPPRRTLGCLTALALVAFSASGVDNGVPSWRYFLAAPTYETFRQHSSFWTAQCDSSRPSSAELHKALRLLSDGNSAVFQALLDTRKCLDGSDLEDFYRATGLYFQKQPHGFVALAAQEGIQSSELSYMLSMLPLETVDQPRLRLSLIEDRIAILSVIKGTQLSATADACKDVLTAEAKVYRGMLGNVAPDAP
jgi:hypothetical protein